MSVTVRAFTEDDLDAMLSIWNQVVADGVAFPQQEALGRADGLAFFRAQSFTGVAETADGHRIAGLYILHPNNVGRCGHIANASFAVDPALRGRHTGEALVKHCLATAKAQGFRIMQFNAVVSTNVSALHLYEKLGFVRLGVIPGGFLLKDGSYADIIPHYYLL